MSQTNGNSSTPVIAIGGALALSVALFFAFTLPQCGGKKEVADTGDGETPDATDPNLENGGKPPEIEPIPEKVKEPEPEPVKVEKFGSPRELIKTLAVRLSAGDVDRVKALVGEDVLAEPRALGFLYAFGKGGYELAQGEAFAEIGDIEKLDSKLNRWALYVRAKGEGATDVGTPDRITVDVAKNVENGWAVAGVQVPDALRKIAAAAGVTLPDGTAPAVDVNLDRADPLFVANDFVSSLLSQDFEKALDLCGDKVPDEKIAGLCMVFEEGEFSMVKQKPLTTTSLGKDKKAAWVFARVRSDKMDANGEFAVELKVDETNGWEVENVNIESMLQEFVKGSEAGRVPFTPIKTNPDGGETLVLYFEYDKAELLPRSLRQVNILSRILKADSEKTLNIGGHADAHGSDEYNRKLSGARAVKVRDALITFGVPESQILVTAFGEAKPWKENTADDGSDNPEGRQHNRRAEIYLNF